MKHKLIQHFITRKPGSWMCHCGYGELNRNTTRMLKHILARHPVKVKELAKSRI